MPESSFPELRSVAGALWGHIERAIAARLPVLERVIELSEREVLAAVMIVQNINAESKRALKDLEVVASCLSTNRVKNAPASLGDSVAQQADAYAHFVGLCGTTERKLSEQQGLAGKASVAVKRILNIVGEVDGIAQRACITTFNARIESARMGAAARTFDVIADELRDMTEAVQRLNVEIKSIGEELMKVIPVMAEGAGTLRESHAHISASLGKHMAEVCDSQRRAMAVLNDAVVAGRARTDEIVEQSHEVMSRLQFQDRISQDLSALINQEIASGELVERSLMALDSDERPEPDDVEREGRAIEEIRHGNIQADESDDESPGAKAEPAGAMLFF